MMTSSTEPATWFYLPTLMQPTSIWINHTVMLMPTYVFRRWPRSFSQWPSPHHIPNHQICLVFDSRIQTCQPLHLCQRNDPHLSIPDQNGLASTSITNPNQQHNSSGHCQQNSHGQNNKVHGHSPLVVLLPQIPRTIPLLPEIWCHQPSLLLHQCPPGIYYESQHPTHPG